MSIGSVFISHSNPSVAIAFDEVLAKCLPGGVDIFNSSRPDRGLSPGNAISGSILESIRDIDIYVSIWSPTSLAKPAWMSWELGAAVAQGKAPLIARALGTTVDDLPLNLRGTFSPDLADPRSLYQFCRSIAYDLVDRYPETPVDLDALERALESPAARSLNATERLESRISASHFGRRLLIENNSDSDLADIEFSVEVRGPSADYVDEIAAPMERAFEWRLRRLQAHERIVVMLKKGVPYASLEPFPITFTWLVKGIGRERSLTYVTKGRA